MSSDNNVLEGDVPDEGENVPIEDVPDEDIEDLDEDIEDLDEESEDSDEVNEDEDPDEDESNEEGEENPDKPKYLLGCEHYRRKCQLVAPCCGRTYTCRFCHDDKENHQLIRTNVMEVVCLVCQLTQKVSNLCDACQTVFGNYFCTKCRLFDDEDKKQFHCDECGLCRVGGQDKFFHCVKCGLCFNKSTKDTHKCVENASKTNCPVCLEDIHSSRVSGYSLPCGHMVHNTCYKDLLNNGNYTCPLCNISMVDMKSVWAQLDNEIAATPMPEEYSRMEVKILCRDCHKNSQVKFHVVGLKCQFCGSYNTTRTSGLIPVEPVPEPESLPQEPVDENQREPNEPE